MRKLFYVAVLVVVIAASALPCARGQAPTAVVTTCENSHKILTPKNPRTARNGTIVPGQAITQATVALRGVSTMQIVEHPQSGKGVDEYNTTVTVLDGQQAKTYLLKELIKGGESLRLVEAATVCESPDQGSAFLAFEAGATGSMEGFVIVRYSAEGIDLQALPPVTQGRISVQAGKITMWSAIEGSGIECAACKKRYSVQICQLGRQQVTCSRQQSTVGPFAPDKFMRSRIEVR